MKSILCELMTYQYHGFALCESLAQLPKKVDNSDYMSAFDNLRNVMNKLKEKGV